MRNALGRYVAIFDYGECKTPHFRLQEPHAEHAVISRCHGDDAFELKGLIVASNSGGGTDAMACDQLIHECRNHLDTATVIAADGHPVGERGYQRLGQIQRVVRNGVAEFGECSRTGNEVALSLIITHDADIE